VSSARVKGLIRYADAPISTACALSSGNARPLITRMGMSRKAGLLRMNSQTSYPLDSGSTRSRQAKSGAISASRRRADLPSAASTTNSPMCSRYILTSLRMTESSSTKSTVCLELSIYSRHLAVRQSITTGKPEASIARRPRRSLTCASAGHYRRNGPKDQVEIADQAPVIDVLKVHVHPLFERDLIAAARLPNASQAGSNGQAPPLPGLVLHDLAGYRWPGSHDAHFAAQHVDELRQLVDRVPSHPAADRGDPRITLDLEYRSALLVVRFERLAQPFGVGDHRTKLEHMEGFAVYPDAALLEAVWSSRGQLDRQRDQGEEGQQQPEGDRRCQDVEQALERHLPGLWVYAEVVHVAVGDRVVARWAR